MRPAGQSHGGASERTGRIPIQLLLTPVDGATPSDGHRSAGTESRTYERPPTTPASLSRSSTADARRSLPVQMLINTDAVPETVTLPPIKSAVSRSGSSQSSQADGSSPTYYRDAAERGWDATEMTRRPRASRPSYSEEQKFFIMYARIIRDYSWPEIEDQFADIFGQRSKGGLTSVYYRVRKDWGLSEVLKSGPGSFAADCREAERRALNFSAEFLAQIGYIEQPR